MIKAQRALNVSLDLVKCVGEKYRQSRERIAAGTIKATSEAIPFSLPESDRSDKFEK